MGAEVNRPLTLADCAACDGTGKDPAPRSWIVRFLLGHRPCKACHGWGWSLRPMTDSELVAFGVTDPTSTYRHPA